MQTSPSSDSASVSELKKRQLKHVKVNVRESTKLVAKSEIDRNCDCTMNACICKINGEGYIFFNLQVTRSLKM